MYLLVENCILRNPAIPYGIHIQHIFQFSNEKIVYLQVVLIVIHNEIYTRNIFLARHTDDALY